MKYTIFICAIVCIVGGIFCNDDDGASEQNKLNARQRGDQDQKGCWMKVNAPPVFDGLEKIDNKYAAARKVVQNHFDKIQFDNEMLQTMLKYRAAAQREIIKPQSQHGKIPAGMNLGGRCMIRLPDSVLFFHRMKLRNNTSFQISVLHNDMEHMVMRLHMALNDLHLKGAYERTMTDRDPAALIYSPSFGELELLLKDVQFSVEGRYRLIKKRLVIEVIISELKTQAIMLTHVNSTTNEGPMRIHKDNLGDFLNRLKTDLNKWLQDYINDYLIYYDLEKVPSISQLEKYDKEKATVLATFMDSALNIISNKIRTIGGSSIRVPQFSIMAAHGLKVKIYDGSLLGLDTMYRRSVVTTLTRRPGFRYVNCIIAFSNLKVVYKYEISFPSSSPSPALTGAIILSANELIGHLALGLVKEPEVMEIDIDFLNQIGPNSLTVEGAANLMISNFKHLLNHQILTIMSNTVIYGVEMLRSLPRCEPFLPGQVQRKPVPKLVKIRDRFGPHPEDFNMIDSEQESLRQQEEKTTPPRFAAPTYNAVTSAYVTTI